MTKSDLDTQPVFVFRKERIHAQIEAERTLFSMRNLIRTLLSI